MESFILFFNNKPNFPAICCYLEAAFKLALPLNPVSASGINSVTVTMHISNFKQIDELDLLIHLQVIALMSFNQVRIESNGHFNDSFLSLP